jgi:hypothetical protein
VQQPAKPDALAPAAFADAVHAVVPIAAADQRKAMIADRQARVQRTGTMFVEACSLARDDRLEEAVALAWLQRVARQERDNFIEHGGVGGDSHIVRDGVGEPYAVVRYARAHSLA